VKRFVEGQDRAQLMLLPECLDDFVGEDNTVRVVDAFKVGPLSSANAFFHGLGRTSPFLGKGREGPEPADCVEKVDK
jgi:hypothetical protein